MKKYGRACGSFHKRPGRAIDALARQERLLQELAVGEIAVAVAQRLLLEALEVVEPLLCAPLHAVVHLLARVLPARRILEVVQLGDLAELVQRRLHDDVRAVPALFVLEAIEREHGVLREAELVVQARHRLLAHAVAARVVEHERLPAWRAGGTTSRCRWSRARR